MRSKWAVAMNNAASLGADEKTGNVRYGKGRLIKVLWGTWWREKPLTTQQAEQIGEGYAHTEGALPASKAHLSD